MDECRDGDLPSIGDWLYPNSLVPVHKEAPRPEYKINGKKTALVEIRKDV